jgi:hypothetical protein
MNVTTYQCSIHGKTFKGPNSKGIYWHLINYDTQEYCHKTPQELGANLNPTTKEEFLPGETREPIKQTNLMHQERDYDGENRGKIRHGVICAIIEHEGLVNLRKLPTDTELQDTLNYLVEYIFTGK